MAQLIKRVHEFIAKQGTDPIEFGNLRKGIKWGEQIDNHLVWIFSVDLIWARGLQYKIVYNLEEKKFSGSSSFDRHSNQERFVQFNTNDFKTLKARVIQLAQDIPTFREKILREYIFSKFQNKVNVRWSKLFKNEKKGIKEETYLLKLVNNIRRGGRISESELNRSIHYINRVRSI